MYNTSSPWPGIEPSTSVSRVERSIHKTTAPCHRFKDLTASLQRLRHLLDVLLQDLVVSPGHLLGSLDDAVDVLRRLLELHDAAVEHVVAPEPAGQCGAGDEGEEAEAAPDGPRLPLLGVLGVAASRAKVDQQNHLKTKKSRF